MFKSCGYVSYNLRFARDSSTAVSIFTHIAAGSSFFSSIFASHLLVFLNSVLLVASSIVGAFSTVYTGLIETKTFKNRLLIVGGL